MIARALPLCGLLAASLVAPAAAAPVLLEPPPGERDTGMVWAPMVMRSVAPERLTPAPPHVPAGASTTVRSARIGPDRAAAFWLDRLDVVRITRVGGPADATLRAARVVGEGAAAAIIDETEWIEPLDRKRWVVVQSPAGGAVWRLTADRPIEVTVERLARRRARVIWETARRDLLDMARGVDRPLPAVAGATGMMRSLDIARGLADRIGAPDDPEDPVGAALRAWTAAVASELWAGEAPFDGDVWALSDPLSHRSAVTLALPDTAASAFSEWVELPDGHSEALRFDDGGVLRLEARALEPGVAAPVVRLAVGENDQLRLEPRSVAANIDLTPDAAFPARAPLATADGRPVGPKASGVWALPRAELPLTLAVTGGPALVRLTHGRLRPLLDEAIAGPVSVAERLAFARRALAERDDPTARRARVLVEGLADPTSACAAEVDDAVLAAWAAVRCLSVRPEPARFESLPALLDGAQAADERLTWALRFEAAERAQRAGRPDATALLPEVGPELPEDVAREVERRRPRPPVHPDGAAAARAEEAWRRAPTDRDARARVIRTWSHTVWSAVRPTGVRHPPRRWLTTGLDPRPDDEDLKRLVALQPGGVATVTLPPPPAGLGRSTRLRLVAVRPDGAPFELSVGETRYRVEAGAPVEELAFAAAPGPHRVTLHAGPDGLALWLEGEIETPPETTGRVEWAWPVSGPDGPLRFELPLAMDRHRLKLAVRGLGIEQTRLEVRADIGPVRTVDLRFAGADPDARPLDDGPAPSRPVEVVIELPSTTGAVTLHSADGARLLVRPTLRTPALVEPAVPEGVSSTAAGPSPNSNTPNSDTPLAVVGRTSAVLAHRPADWQARIRRAHALLDLDLTHVARIDIDRLRFDAPPEMAGQVDGLLARYGAARDPDVLPMAVAAGAAVMPLDALIVPAATPADAPRATLAREARARRAQRAWAEAARLHLLLYRETNGVAAAREALIDLRAALRADPTPPPTGSPDAPPAEATGLASLAFGALSRMDDDGRLTGISGIRGPASAGSTWLTIEAMEAAAGYETLRLPALSPYEPLSLQVRTAMLAAPWPAADGHHLVPGQGATLALRLSRPVALAAEVWCVPDAEDRPCRLRIRDGDGEPEIRRVPAGQKTAVSLGERRGRVALDVVLLSGGSQAAGVRFVADRTIADETSVGGGGLHVIRPIRKRRVFRALSGRPIELTAEGPGAVRIEGWRPTRSAAKQIAVRIVGPDGVERRQTVELDQGPAWARGEGRRPLQVGRTSRRVIPLLDDGAHRVSIVPDAGEALMRLAVRVDEQGEQRPSAPPMTWRLVPFDGTGLPYPLAPPDAADARVPGRWGTLSVLASWLQIIDDEPTGESEDAGEGRVPAVGELAVIGRRRFDDTLGARRVYGKLAPALRADLDGRLVFGGRGSLRLDGLGPGLGLDLDGEGWAGEPGFSVRGRLTLWRGFRLAPDWRLTPSARLWWGRYVDQTIVDTGIDPVLGTDWRLDHARGLRVGGSLRWQMLRAQHLRLRLDGFTNDDFASLDRVDPALSWTAVFGLSPISTLKGYLGYRPSLRFADDDRRDTGLTHQISVGLDAGFWVNRETRLVLGGRFRPTIGLDGGWDPRFVLSIGLDFTSRSLIDFDPIEEPYPDLAGRRFWLPPREVDR